MDATLGHSSAHSFATGPVIADPETVRANQSTGFKPNKSKQFKGHPEKFTRTFKEIEKKSRTSRKIQAHSRMSRKISRTFNYLQKNSRISKDLQKN